MRLLLDARKCHLIGICFGVGRRESTGTYAQWVLLEDRKSNGRNIRPPAGAARQRRLAVERFQKTVVRIILQCRKQYDGGYDQNRDTQQIEQTAGRTLRAGEEKQQHDDSKNVGASTPAQEH